jgi:hypothetical protein
LLRFRLGLGCCFRRWRRLFRGGLLLLLAAQALSALFFRFAFLALRLRENHRR